jgi:hypothetical protein
MEEWKTGRLEGWNKTTVEGSFTTIQPSILPLFHSPHLPTSLPSPVPLPFFPTKKPETWGERTQCVRFLPIGSRSPPSTDQSSRRVPSFSVLSVQEIVLFCTLSFFFIFLPCLSLAGWRPPHSPCLVSPSIPVGPPLVGGRFTLHPPLSPPTPDTPLVAKRRPRRSHAPRVTKAGHSSTIATE